MSLRLPVASLWGQCLKENVNSFHHVELDGAPHQPEVMVIPLALPITSMS